MATFKQKKTAEKLLENPRLSVSAAMKEAGYSSETAKVPSDLTRSKGWAELMEEYMPDDLLQKIHKEGFGATRIHGTNDNFIDIPDYAVRHKYLETAYKLKGKLIEKAQFDGKLEVVLTREG